MGCNHTAETKYFARQFDVFVVMAEEPLKLANIMSRITSGCDSISSTKYYPRLIRQPTAERVDKTDELDVSGAL